MPEQDRARDGSGPGPPGDEAWFRGIVETIPHMVWVAAPGGENVYNNARLLAYTGFTSEELTGGAWARTIHPDDLPGAVEYWTRAVATGVAGDRRHRVRGRDGTYRWFRVAAAPLRDAEGRIVRWIGTWTDVHDAVLAEEALREAERHHREVLDAIPQIVWTCDPAGRCDFLSRQWTAYTGVAPEAALGSAWLESVHPEDRDATAAAWREAVASGAMFDVRFRIRGADGRHRWFRTRAVALRDERGAVARWFGTNTDVDDQVRAADALAEADRRKGEFLGILSHELRNPLAPIRNALLLLDRAPAGSAQAARAREVLERQTLHLARLVDDLLDVTRISRGKIELSPERLDVADVVRRTCEDHRPLFEERGVALAVELPSEPAWADADPVRLAQIVGNLLLNAARFTPGGGSATAAVARVGERVAIRVRDTGAGIDPELLPRVFEPFVQAQRGLARTEGGLGLGLALVKGLAEQHGGAVRAASAGRDRGTEVVVELPAAPPPAADRGGAAGAGGARPLVVLVVEDNEDAARTLAEVLEIGGHRVHVALRGREGIALAREVVPDLVLCDIGLPDVTGFEVARALRAEPALRATRVVALSGYAQPEDRARAAEAGFHAHVAKPPTLDALEALLASVAADRGAAR